MRKAYAAALLLAALCLSGTGCAANSTGSNESSTVLWVGIEPAEEDEFGKATYEDGLYLSQTVSEPLPDPFAKDKKRVKDGTTDEGIRYTLYEQHAEITGHTEKFAAEELVIPETISGLPVTRIVSVAMNEENKFEVDKTGGFCSCYTLSKVTLPDGLYEIGDYAFYGCKNLKEAVVPESVMKIGTRAFAMCSSLTALTVPSGIGSVGDSAFSLTPWYDDLLYHRDLIIFNGRLYDAGRRCTGEIVVPDYVISVEDNAFYSCGEVTAIILPESVRSVGKCAFRDCPKLKAVVFRNPDCKIYSDTSTFSNKKNTGDKDYFRGTIYSEKDSAVHQFAKKYRYHFDETGAYQPESHKSS